MNRQVWQCGHRGDAPEVRRHQALSPRLLQGLLADYSALQGLQVQV